MNTFWSQFGRHIRCINLTTRPDRRATSQATFNSLGIPVRYFITDKHPNGGAHGCYDSHWNVVKEAYEDGVPYVLVFEDDVVVNERCAVSSKLQEAHNFLNTPATNWDIFYLGIIPTKILNTASHRVGGCSSVYTTGGCGTQAYILNRQGMEKLLKLPYFGVAIDMLYKKYFRGVAIYPSLFYQAPAADSDIASPLAQTIQPLLLQVGRFLEWYAYHLGIPLSTLASGVGACIIALLVGRV